MNLLVYITVPDITQAEELAGELVAAHLAAGVNVAGPVLSIYRWQGGIHKAREWQLFVQTGSYAGLEAFVLEHHPHLVPCIIGFNIACGNKPFLEWIDTAGEGTCARQS